MIFLSFSVPSCLDRIEPKRLKGGDFCWPPKRCGDQIFEHRPFIAKDGRYARPTGPQTKNLTKLYLFAQHWPLWQDLPACQHLRKPRWHFELVLWSNLMTLSLLLRIGRPTGGPIPPSTSEAWWTHPLIKSHDTVSFIAYREAGASDLPAGQHLHQPRRRGGLLFWTNLMTLSLLLRIGRPVPQTYRRASTSINLGGVVDSSSEQISWHCLFYCV